MTAEELTLDLVSSISDWIIDVEDPDGFAVTLADGGFSIEMDGESFSVEVHKR